MAHLRMEKETGKSGASICFGDPGWRNPVRDERGIALVVALVMLALLSILGSMALYTSSTELRIAGNYRLSNEAFYVADAALEYAYTDPEIYMEIVPGPQPNPNFSWPPGMGTTNERIFSGPNGDNLARIRVEWEDCGQPPVGSGGSAEAAIGVVKPNRYNYYVVSVVGNLAEPLPPTEISIESREGRLALSCPGE